MEVIWRVSEVGVIRRIVQMHTGLLLALAALVIVSVGRPVLAAETAPGETPVPAHGLAEAQDAIVRIRAVGLFVDPEKGQPADVVVGTGFIIDPEGLAITNNHVVAGADALQVSLPGESRPRTAQIVALSECTDLALIDIAGKGYPYLAFREEEIEPGTAIFAAGYPAERYKLSSGMVERVLSDSASNLVVLNREIIHNAPLAQGNSGGPLLDDEGRVVGINFGSSGSTGLFAAIATSEARALVEQVQRGESVQTLGINASAWTASQRTGLWITAVHPDLPASDANLHPGDLLLELNGTPLSTDRTVADYCDILLGWNHRTPLLFKVQRAGSEEIQIGEFVNEQTGVASSAASSYDASSYTRLQHPPFAAMLPAEWTDVAVAPGQQPGSFTLSAAPRLSENRRVKGGPGVTVLAQPVPGRVNQESFLDDTDQFEQDCEYQGRSSHQHTFAGATYRGLYDRWDNCFDVEATVFVLAVQPESNDLFLAATFVALTADDDASFDVFRNTLSVSGQPTPAPAPVQQEADNPVVATVLVELLNVRSGPSTDYSRMGSVGQGEQLQVTGRAGDCTWLAVTTPAGLDGWVSADPSYISWTGDCSRVPLRDVPPP